MTNCYNAGYYYASSGTEYGAPLGSGRNFTVSHFFSLDFGYNRTYNNVVANDVAFFDQNGLKSCASRLGGNFTTDSTGSNRRIS